MHLVQERCRLWVRGCSVLLVSEGEWSVRPNGSQRMGCFSLAFSCSSRIRQPSFRQITARFVVPLFLPKCSHFALTSPQCRHCRPEASCSAPVHFSMCFRKLSGSTFFISNVRHFRNAAIIPGNHLLFCHSSLSFSDSLSIVFSYKFYFYCSKVP